MDRREIPVVIAFDKNILVQAKVCLQSLLKSSVSGEFYHIICMHKSIAKDDLKQFSRLVSTGENCSIEYIDMSDHFKDAYTAGAGPDSVVTYYRFLIPRLLNRYERIIYVDVDYIFRSGLGDLYYNEDLEGYYLAGVRDLGIINLYRDYLQKMGINPNKYINAGFLLMNLKLINQDKLVEVWLKEAADKNVKRIFMDQDILNLTCHGKIKFLRAKYNFISMEEKNLFDPDEYEEAVKKGNIHYAGKKPWLCWRGIIWWKYYFKLPFNQRNICFFMQSLCYITYHSLFVGVKFPKPGFIKKKNETQKCSASQNN